jgi:hypothetical protein
MDKELERNDYGNHTPGIVSNGNFRFYLAPHCNKRQKKEG